VQGRFLVLTPEKVVVERRFASLPARAIAHLVDLFLALSAAAGIGLVLAALGAGVGPEAALALQALGSFFGLLAYFVLQEWLWRGQTLGKAALGLRVAMVDGTPVTFAAATYRNLVRFADMLPAGYALGMAAMLANARAQRLGDLVADTVVVAEPRVPDSFVPAPHHAGIHPIEPHLPSLSRMRIEEYTAIKRLCDRFPDLTPEAQEEGLRRIWRPFAERNFIAPMPNVHPVYQMEASVMKYGRMHNLL
jgi:uncharacterized RDD family membrane protein YckC